MFHGLLVWRHTLFLTDFQHALIGLVEIDQHDDADLYRYAGKETNYNAGVYTATQPEWVSELTDTQRAVLEPAYGRSRPEILNDGETLVEDAHGSGLGQMFWERKQAKDAGGSEADARGYYANGVRVPRPGDREEDTAEQRRRNGGW